ncbi:MAG: S1C family serine protease [Vulcanimicrobiaceae bacterium]
MTITNSSALAALSAELASAVATVGNSVVYVDANPRRDASGLAWDEHTIVTIDHVIEREDEIDILLAGGGKARATLAGRDPSTDLALLRTEATLVPAARANLDELAVGHLVLAVGRDEDGAPGATLGVVSSLDGPWRTWRGGDVDRFIRPDLNVYPTFSGGPLVDASGKVVGINTWGLSRRMALTVPVSTIERVVAQLARGGRIRRGYLGVALQAVRLPQSARAALGLSQESGAIVVDVAPDGPADRAGMLIGDVILALGTTTVADSDDVQHALGGDSVGNTLPVRLLRAGSRHELSIAIEERPHDES